MKLVQNFTEIDINNTKFLKILKPKIIFVDSKFKITLNNNVTKIIIAVCKEVL